jgi:hypothetical protein
MPLYALRKEDSLEVAVHSPIQPLEDADNESAILGTDILTMICTNQLSVMKSWLGNIRRTFAVLSLQS